MMAKTESIARQNYPYQIIMQLLERIPGCTKTVHSAATKIHI